VRKGRGSSTWGARRRRERSENTKKIKGAEGLTSAVVAEVSPAGRRRRRPLSVYSAAYGLSRRGRSLTSLHWKNPRGTRRLMLKITVPALGLRIRCGSVIQCEKRIPGIRLLFGKNKAKLELPGRSEKPRTQNRDTARRQRRRRRLTPAVLPARPRDSLPPAGQKLRPCLSSACGETSGPCPACCAIPDRGRHVEHGKQRGRRGADGPRGGDGAGAEGRHPPAPRRAPAHRPRRRHPGSHPPPAPQKKTPPPTGGYS
jgi:hypothetical protein